jgi:hypothetical protein
MNGWTFTKEIGVVSKKQNWSYQWENINWMREQDISKNHEQN